MKILKLALQLVTIVIVASSSWGQQPLWSNEFVPEQPPVRNSVPNKHDAGLLIENGPESPYNSALQRLARIHDDQTYQDTGDPVVPTIGMVSHKAVDLYIAGRGIDFVLERRYSSAKSDVDGPLGFGWDHSYNARLQIQPGSQGAVVDIHIYGSQPMVEFAAFVACAGDVNADGFADIALSAPWFQRGPFVRNSSGSGFAGTSPIRGGKVFTVHGRE